MGQNEIFTMRRPQVKVTDGIVGKVKKENV